MTPVASLLLLLVVVATVAVQEGRADEYRDYGVVDKTKFMKHYARKKIIESCFGTSIANEWYKWMDQILVKCHKEIDMKKEGAVRKRRSSQAEESSKPFYNEGKVRHIKDKLLERIQFVNCTLDKLNITMTPEGTVDTTTHIGYLEGLDMDAELKEDVIKGVEKCAMIKPCDTFKDFGPIDVDFQKKMRFVRCDQRRRMNACVRKDFRNYRDQFELQGLDGLFDDINDDMMKMMGVATAYANLLDGDMDVFI